MMTTTDRTLQALKKQGFRPERCERFYGGRKHDAWGLIDVMCPLPDKYPFTWSIVGIQACRKKDASQHLEKIFDTPEIRESAKLLLHCGWKLQLWIWEKEPIKPGSKRSRWMYVVREIISSDFKDKEQR